MRVFHFDLVDGTIVADAGGIPAPILPRPPKSQTGLPTGWPAASRNWSARASQLRWSPKTRKKSIGRRSMLWTGCCCHT